MMELQKWTIGQRKNVWFAANVLQFCYMAAKYLKAKRKKKRLPKAQPPKGSFGKTFLYIKSNNTELFFKYTRMSAIQFDLLFSMVKDSLKNTSIKRGISLKEQLAVTLIYLTQGVSWHCLASSVGMGVSIVREIIAEVCSVLWLVLSPIYIPALDLDVAAKDFANKWEMPNCIGSVDGKHVQIKCPLKSGGQYYNYKGYFSIVIMAVCDANYVFSAVDVGGYGSHSNVESFRRSKFGQTILNNDLLNIAEANLPNSSKSTPFYFAGDSVFPLNRNLMKPYPAAVLLDPKKKNFNIRLSNARSVIENAFGILCARWRILLSAIEYHPNIAERVVLACVILHNFVKITDSSYNFQTYAPASYTDSFDIDDNLIPGLWRQEIIMLPSVNSTGSSNNCTREAAAIRETLADYLFHEAEMWGDDEM